MGRRRRGGHDNTSAGIGLQQEEDGASRIETLGCVVALALAGGLVGGFSLLLSLSLSLFPTLDRLSHKGSRVVEMESVRAVGDLASEFRLSRTHGDDQ
jgi:hypothetical protein